MHVVSLCHLSFRITLAYISWTEFGIINNISKCLSIRNENATTALVIINIGSKAS